ncbi:hypothetical protein D3C71_1640730 [compost metagenome]
MMYSFTRFIFTDNISMPPVVKALTVSILLQVKSLPPFNKHPNLMSMQPCKVLYKGNVNGLPKLRSNVPVFYVVQSIFYALVMMS